MREKRSGCPAACAGGNERSWQWARLPAAKISLKGYHGGMVLRRTPHAVYATLSHLVWSPTYRRDVLHGEVQRRVQGLCADIAEPYDMTRRRWRSVRIMSIFLLLPAAIFHGPSRDPVQKCACSGPFFAHATGQKAPVGRGMLEDGYCARTVGDKVTAEVIRRYIQQHRNRKTWGRFNCPCLNRFCP